MDIMRTFEFFGRCARLIGPLVASLSLSYSPSHTLQVPDFVHSHQVVVSRSSVHSTPHKALQPRPASEFDAGLLDWDDQFTISCGKLLLYAINASFKSPPRVDGHHSQQVEMHYAVKLS